MDRSAGYIVVLDASVLFPGFLSNLLIWLAQADLFQVKWSNDIHDEWIRNRHERYGIDVSVLKQCRTTMDEKFPDALVTGYEMKSCSLTGINEKDRHVVAVAIECGANAIVTSNLEDFPADELSKDSILPISQDDFVLDQLELTATSKRAVAIAIVSHKKSMTKTKPTWKKYFESMARPGVGLQKTHSEVTSAEFKLLLKDVIRVGDWLLD
jgi:predicted nucleic acid-binding protein